MHARRRAVLSILAGLVASMSFHVRRAVADPHVFISAAFEMKKQAERSGDEPYGAVVVLDDEIVGWAPSRVIVNGDPAAHAEREAIRDAQKRLGSDLSGCTLYSTSRPCSACEQSAAEARIARMVYGPDAVDAGTPRD
jgi:tRNA(Arg) A34 adenosine deaminase TadA